MRLNHVGVTSSRMNIEFPCVVRIIQQQACCSIYWTA